jgi:hypothetical protein
MATHLYGINELACPVCGKLLTSDEYEHAIEEISLRLGQEYQEQIKKDRSEYEGQIERDRKISQEKIDNINKNYNEHITVLRDELAASYKQQFEVLKKNYEELDLQRQRNNKQSLDEKIGDYEEKIRQKEIQSEELEQELRETKQNAVQDARAALQTELHSKDIEIRERDEQIQHYKGNIEELKEQLSTTQPELKGEAGEQVLLEDLREAFPEDQFSRQTRGISEGDILQHIRTPSGTILKTPIVYDNKEVGKVTRKEVEKQRYYKEHEGTDYLLVVSPNLPRNIKNGVLGKKEGVSLVRRDIVVEVAEYLRNAIIEISKSCESKKHQDTKQARVYDYITSRDFCRKLESADADNSEMMAMQNKEEKDHQTMWKKRKAIVQRSRDSYIAISSEIDAIIHGQPKDPNTN